MLTGVGFAVRRYGAAASALLIACGPEDTRGVWGAATRISSGRAFDAFAPEVAMDAQGSAIVVWQQGAPTGWSDLLAARQTADGSWQDAVVVDMPSHSFARLQRVAMDAAGNAVAVWERGVDSYTVWASRFSPAGGWTPPERLTPAGEQGRFPQLALDPSGNALAVWSLTEQPGRHGVTVWASRLEQGRWEPAQTIQGPQPETGGGADVAVSADGTGLVVWGELQNGVFRTWVNRFHPQRGWAAAEPISHEDLREGAPLGDIAMDAMGNGIMVGRRWAGGGIHDIVANRYETGRGWDTPRIVAAERRAAESPQMAMDAAGNAAVVWYEGYEGSPGDVVGVWAVRFAIGAGWGRPVLLQADVGPLVEPPRIAMDAEGNGTAVWQRLGADRLDVFTARFDVRGGWSTPLILGSSPRAGAIVSNIGAAVVAMSPGGDAVAAWSQPDDGQHAIWASRFDDREGRHRAVLPLRTAQTRDGASD